MSQPLTDEEIQRIGFKALIDALGPAGAIRFIQRYRPGRGDYTAERQTWLKDVTLEELIRESRQLEDR